MVHGAFSRVRKRAYGQEMVQKFNFQWKEVEPMTTFIEEKGKV